MSDSNPKKLDPNTAFILVALFCCIACGLIALTGATIVGRLTTIETGFMFAVASMVMWPAFLGVGISYFIYRTSIRQPYKDLD